MKVWGIMGAGQGGLHGRGLHRRGTCTVPVEEKKQVGHQECSRTQDVPRASRLAAPIVAAPPPRASPEFHCRTTLIQTRIGRCMRAVISLKWCFHKPSPSPKASSSSAALAPPFSPCRLPSPHPHSLAASTSTLSLRTVDARGGVVLDAQVDVLADAKAWG
jgi:hypothetical protein